MEAMRIFWFSVCWPVRQGVSRPLSERLKGRVEAVTLPSAPRTRSFFSVLLVAVYGSLIVLTSRLGARASLSGNDALVPEISTRNAMVKGVRV